MRATAYTVSDTVLSQVTQFIWSRLILRWYIVTTDVFTRYLGTLWAAPLPLHHFPRLPRWWPLPLMPGAASLIHILDKYKYKYIQIPELNSTLLIWQIQTQISGATVKCSIQIFSSFSELFVSIYMKAPKILTLLTFLIKCQSNVNHTDELRFSLESFQIKLLSTAFTSFLNSDLSSFSLRLIITIKDWKRRGGGA